MFGCDLWIAYSEPLLYWSVVSPSSAILVNLCGMPFIGFHPVRHRILYRVSAIAWRCILDIAKVAGHRPEADTRSQFGICISINILEKRWNWGYDGISGCTHIGELCYSGIWRILDMKSTTTWVAAVDSWRHWVKSSLGSIIPRSIDLLVRAGRSPSNNGDADNKLWASISLRSMPRYLSNVHVSIRFCHVLEWEITFLLLSCWWYLLILVGEQGRQFRFRYGCAKFLGLLNLSLPPV